MKKKYNDPKIPKIPEIVLDPWQRDVMATEGNMVLRSGRQVGKSFIIGKKASEYALNNKNKLIMVIAFTEKQANLLFSKILRNIVQTNKAAISKPKPTKHIIHLKNGSTIHCYAAGDTGFGIMGFTIDLLIADEAAWIKEEVWNSITPALAITRGNIWLLSTPWLSEGYYYDCFNDPTFTAFHQSAEDCPRKDQTFLDNKKKTLTKSQYAQMYLGEFVDDFQRIFSDEWIDSVCTLSPETPPFVPGGETYLGIDCAAMGDDESTFEGFDKRNDTLFQFYHETTTKTRTTDTIKTILDLHARYNFNKIGVDGGGLGIGIVDHLLIMELTKRKVVDLNNAKRVIDADKRQTKLLKEAMYLTLLGMGERGKIKLFDDPDIRRSLRTITGEKTDRGVKISGKYSHITEGIIRAAWLGKGKSLNPTIYSLFKI